MTAPPDVNSFTAIPFVRKLYPNHTIIVCSFISYSACDGMNMKVTPNPSRLREEDSDFHFVIRLEMTLGLHIRKT